MTRVTVNYKVRGMYGEFVAKSSTLTAQQMVDKMHAEAKPGIDLRFFDGNGLLFPSTPYNRVECLTMPIGYVNKGIL
jgi:hypothetical protein